MNAQQFQDRAVDWLRREQSFSTDVLPGHKIADAEGRLRVKGYFARPSSAGRWGIASLWTLSIGTILVMMNLPAIGSAANAAIQNFGVVVLAGGVLCVVVAEVLRRKHRTRATIELRPASGAATTPETVDGLHRAAEGTAAWLIAETMPSEDVRSRAAERGVRCFVPRGSQFRELAPGERHGSSEPADAPPSRPEVGAVA